MEETIYNGMGKKKISSIALALWLIIIVIFMLFAGHFDFEIFFVLGFMGILAIAGLAAPRFVKPGFLRHISYLVVAGLLIFGAIVIQNLISILTKKIP